MATIVLCHGAWSSAWAWKKVRPLMAADGHTFFTPSYTGLGERHHLASDHIDLETHIADVLGVLEYEDLRDIVLMGHSYGGMVATGVADRARDRIKLLVYLDAFAPKDGQALADLVPPAARQGMKDSAHANHGFVMPNPSPGDTSPEDLAWISKYRRPQSLRCFEQPLGLQGEMSVPRVYIQCMQYAAKGPFSQFGEHAKTHNDWKFYELDASHSPNVTNPQGLMKVLGQAFDDAGIK